MLGDVVRRVAFDRRELAELAAHLVDRDTGSREPFVDPGEREEAVVAGVRAVPDVDADAPAPVVESERLGVDAPGDGPPSPSSISTAQAARTHVRPVTGASNVDWARTVPSSWTGPGS